MLVSTRLSGLWDNSIYLRRRTVFFFFFVVSEGLVDIIWTVKWIRTFHSSAVTFGLKIISGYCQSNSNELLDNFPMEPLYALLSYNDHCCQNLWYWSLVTMSLCKNTTTSRTISWHCLLVDLHTMAHSTWRDLYAFIDCLLTSRYCKLYEHIIKTY